MSIKLIIPKNELILLRNKKESIPILATEIPNPPKNHHQLNSSEYIISLACPVSKPSTPKIPILSCKIMFLPLNLKKTLTFIAAQNNSAKVTQNRW